MKKRNLIIITAATIAAVLMATGCNRKEVETTPAHTTAIVEAQTTEAQAETTVDQTTPEETTAVEIADRPGSVDGQGAIGMPSPITNLDSLDAVNAELGSALATPENLQVSDEQFLMIESSPKLGEYRFKVDDTEYSLRAGRTMGDISGVYLAGGDTAGIALDIEFDPGAAGVLQTEEGFVGRFFANDVQYLLFARDLEDDKAFAEVLEELKSAVEKQAAEGAEDKIIAPLQVEASVNGKVEDGILPVELLINTLEQIEDTYVIKATLYTEDLYDAVDVNLLEVGDKIVYDGNLIVIKEIVKENGVIVINDGFDQGGCTLIPNEGGTYVAQEWDDYATYSCRGTLSLAIAEDAVLNDEADIENPEKYLGLQGEELIERLQSGTYPFVEKNTQIRIVDNNIKEINRIYTP